MREGLSPGLDRFEGIRGDAVDLGRKMGGLGADRLHQRASLGVYHLRQPFGLLLHVLPKIEEPQNV